MTIKALLAILDAVPGWLYALALTLSFAAGGYVWVELQAQRVEAAGAARALSALQAQDSKDAAERERVARVDADQVSRAQFRHAEITQENSNEQARRDAARVAHDRELADDNQRLRNIVDTYASGDRREGETDAAACRRDADHAKRLGELLGEALDLSREGESLVRRRDDEVTRLLEQISADRRAVQEAQ